MSDRERIKRIVAYYMRICETSDPFRIAKQLKIEVQFGPLGDYAGCYLFAKNHRCIFINNCLEGAELLFVMAHELGHAIMHRKQNCYFLRNYTCLNSLVEREANLFSAYMVITDDFLEEHNNCSASVIAEMYGCDCLTIESRLK
ncbi:ImmA/IrrE family metallo-endopeptidase [Hungatella sp. L12]|uniref:ImmA/IrrE family metallo-endopeptidase n=1 Tax=Hungatella hominis TaxID=2763050 RepID=A0ABR7HCS6_9FIRM|nr:ImmA/IrrE family metallo-endopeptidase [Hungatella hominis]MBC5710967.1 ImmA/IrrE family metallo-endopeptidase [Hungatella hominis]